MKKNLVIIAAGAATLHLPWLKDTMRRFDVFTVDFSPDGTLKGKGEDFYLAQKGFKPQLITAAIQQLGDNIYAYERIWLPDDDLFITATSINRIFALAHKYKLDIGQPALTADSYFSHKITLQIPLIECHFTNFVEIMAPIIKTQRLLDYSDILREAKTGWGIDALWRKHCFERNYRMAIIDSVPMVHTRPINVPKKGSTIASGIYANSGDPNLEFQRLCEKHQIQKNTSNYIKGARLKHGIPIPAFMAKLMSSKSKRYKTAKK